jgi:tol-pal system protein YbgF
MKKRISTALLVIPIALALAGRPAAADKEQRQMMADLRILQEQSQQLQNLLQSTLDLLNESVKALNARLDGQADSTRKAFADQRLNIDVVTRDLQAIREKVDDNNVRVGQLTSELEALRQSVTALSVPRPSAYDPDPFWISPGTPEPAPPTPPTAATLGQSPMKLFESARADYYAGQYDIAILGFESYIKSFPQSPQAGEAQLLMGNSYLNAGKYEKAIDAYDLAIRIYASSPSVPDAWYYKGVAQKDLKQYDEARASWEYVVKNYQGSTAAVQSQQQLQQLRQQKP